jgi:hypothetical protein
VGERAWVVARKKREKLLLLSIILANNISGTFFSLQVLCKNRRRTQKEERMEGVNSKTKNKLDRV